MILRAIRVNPQKHADFDPRQQVVILRAAHVGMRGQYLLDIEALLQRLVIQTRFEDRDHALASLRAEQCGTRTGLSSAKIESSAVLQEEILVMEC